MLAGRPAGPQNPRLPPPQPGAPLAPSSPPRTMPQHPRLVLSLTLGTLLCAGLAFARPQTQEVEVKTEKVAGNVSLLVGKGGNVGVCASPDGVVVIDTQFADMAPKLLAAIAELSPAPLSFVVDTHWHGDHVGGNESFAAKAPVIAHEEVRRRMAAGSARQPAASARALPVLTYGEGVRLYVAGEDIEVRHVGPAHTDGDSIVWFHTSNVVHLGDLFFNGLFPFVDLDSGGSVRGLTETVGKLLQELPKDVRLIPGHGPAAKLEDLARYHAMLVDAQALVKAALAAKKDVAAMKQEKLLSKYSSWNWAFIDEGKFLDTLVREATAR